MKENKIKKLEEELKRLSEMQKSSEEDRLRTEIQKLSEQTEKMISININLQSKMTEVMIKITDLIRDVRDMVDLLREAAQAEASEKGGLDLTPLVMQFKTMQEQNNQTIQLLQNIAEMTRKTYSKEMLKKAIQTPQNNPQGNYQ